jgi:hypothetical protein
MEVKTMKRWTLLGLIGWLAWTLASPLVAQPFTYQGFLTQNRQPVTNNALPMTFRLFAVPTGGTRIGPEINRNVNVQNGLFTEELDFGTVWTGADRYLEIQVGSTTLSPRVKITPAPYASFAMRPWQTLGSNIFYNDGNVGIGTNNPFARLSLGPGEANTKLALWQGTGSSDVMGLGVGPAQFRLHLHNDTNRFSFLNAPAGSEIMTIRGNGNVGIGTINPADRLHIVGNLRVDSGSIRSWGPITLHPDVDQSGDDVVRFVDSAGSETVRIDRTGYVGIGTSSPQAQLHVAGDVSLSNHGDTLQILPGTLFGTNYSNVATLEIPGDGIIGIWDTLRTTGDLNVGGGRFTLGGGTDPTWRRVQLSLNHERSNTYSEWAGFYGANGNLNVRISPIARYPNHGAVDVLDSAGTTQAMMFVDEFGLGAVVADLKLFRVPDPDDPTRDIWYGCIEGPELAMYVRGTARLVNGRARIELPDHFRKLADEQGMTVQLTPLSPDSKGLCVVRKGLDGIEVAELLNGRGNYEFDWEVKAVRKEHRDFRVYRPWDEVMPGGTDPAEAWEARLKSIQASQARQQASTTNKEVQR